MNEQRTALVVGATGLSGYNIATVLVQNGWRVLGLSRTQRYEIDGVDHLYADVTDQEGLNSVLADQGITHVFYSTWAMQETELQNCEVNEAMIRSLLDVVCTTNPVEHVVLMTGLKHYLGPFEAYAKSATDTPFRESQDRVPYPNFYYNQEDALFELAEEYDYTWSVHRAHTLIGYALGNAMNMGVTLALYAAICRETGEPFVFPGSPEQYNGVTDLTDAELLGEHALWSATAPQARNEAFNSVNGEVFRWRQLWPEVAALLGVEPGEYPGHPTPLEGRMDHANDVWATIVDTYDLEPHRADELASWWHTDADLGRPIETFASMTKSRLMGFDGYESSIASFARLFDRLRADRIIPPVA
ncbi:MAG TPA: SDR family oxidoreductase [Nitriliruptoraceae bacterium]|nr:SDR family oxidoreductase [Nitriliruptoraceae bacterium]